jgi:hypothetical protein
MSLSPAPIAADVTQKGGFTTPAWKAWISQLFAVVSTVNNSGTTALRPVGSAQIPLSLGQAYFDTTLGIPVWIKSLNPTVWVNSAGAPV